MTTPDAESADHPHSGLGAFCAASVRNRVAAAVRRRSPYFWAECDESQESSTPTVTDSDCADVQTTVNELPDLDQLEIGNVKSRLLISTMK